MNIQSLSRKSIRKVSYFLLIIGVMLSSSGINTTVHAQDAEAVRPVTHKSISESNLTASDLSQRYVIFLDGILTSSKDNPYLDGEFGDIKAKLATDSNISRFVYFSYKAVYYAPVYCLGWGDTACTPTLDLVSVFYSPTYSPDDTKSHSIAEQANALDWLIKQVIKREAEHGGSAQIDLVGWSLGGLVSSYWASQFGDEKIDDQHYIRDYIHSIVMIESPVGGLPLAQPFTEGCKLTDLACKLWKAALDYLFGAQFLRNMQVEFPGMDTIPDSIVDKLYLAAIKFPVTSIESANDYIVNSVPFPICLNIDCIPDEALQTPVGFGTQNWQNIVPFKLHIADLGGQLVPKSNPVPNLFAYQPILYNHRAPLHDGRTAQWVSAAIAPIDTIPPTGSWTSPSNGSTINSSSVTLSVNASDNAGGSGVREVRFSAKWNGKWSGIGNDSSAPYSIDWNWCNSGVPSGDVELGFEVWDNANNKWVYSDHNTNYHINKNYDNCGPPVTVTPPTPVVPDGIEVCDGTNYGAPCKTYTFTSNSACTNLASEGWDNKIESLRFKGAYIGDYEIILYDDNSCGTYIARYGSDASTLGMLNNLPGSFRIEQRPPPTTPTPNPPDRMELCDNTNWGAPCKPYTFINNSACINLSPDGWGERADSLRFFGSYVNNYDVILYDDNACQTYNARYGEDAPDLGAFKNAISSIRIEQHPVTVTPPPPGSITLCDGTNYGQPCQAFTYVSNSYCTNLQPHGWGGRADSLKFVDQYVGKFEVILYDDNSCNIYNARYGSDASDLGAFKNSIDSIRIEGRPPPKPDLIPDPRSGRSAPVVISSVGGTTTNDTLYAGEPVFIDWGYKNNGSASALAHNVKLTIDGQTIFDHPFGSLNTGAANGFDDWSTTWNTPGTFTVSLTVDPYSAVDESDEGNNVWSGQFTWIPRPSGVSTTVNMPRVNIGGMALVTVSLNNVPAEGGYTSAEFTCSYNQSLLEESNITTGTLFGTDAVTAINGPQNGRFIVAIAGSNGNKATTSGAVFTFNVKGLQAGQTPIECTARVSKGAGNLLPLPSTGPTALTIGEGTITPTITLTPTESTTPTMTATFTETPTPSSTATPTASQTPTPSSTPTATASVTPSQPLIGTLNGQILATEPVIVRLYDVNKTVVASISANPVGTFSLTVPAGTYTVVATASGFLSAQKDSVTITSGNITTLPTVNLLAGDIDNNNVINQLDAMTIGMNYNTITPTAADLNNDGIINVLDLELLAKNYRKTGPVVWQ